MKVDNNQTNRLTQKQAENANSVEKAQRLSENETHLDSLNRKDKASFSEKARLLAKARVQLDEVSDVRTDRVNKLKEQILSGSYDVPVEELAKRLQTSFKMDLT